MERINIERLVRDIEELGRIGRVASGGVERPTFSPADHEAREWLMGRMREAGLEVCMDTAANIVGRIPGEGGVVMSGSHLDTITKNGGRFDGALGVLTALECARVIKEQNLETKAPIEVVALSDEEDRFIFSLGALAMVGQIDSEKARALKDPDGITLGDAMAEYGFDVEAIGEAKREPTDIKAFVELHIEQGPLLDEEGISVGVVDAVKGNYRYRITVDGRTDHAGRPMNGRRDSCVAAVRMIEELTGSCERHSEKEPTLMTVGQFDVKPGLTNVVPGWTCFTVDLRDVNRDVLKALEGDLKTIADTVSEQFGVSSQIEPLLIVDPVIFSEEIRGISREVADRMGIRWRSIASGAGHDAQIFGEVVPTGMIFVPSRRGVSHSADEWTEAKDIENGTNVLLHTLLRLANG